MVIFLTHCLLEPGGTCIKLKATKTFSSQRANTQQVIGPHPPPPPTLLFNSTFGSHISPEKATEKNGSLGEGRLIKDSLSSKDHWVTLFCLSGMFQTCTPPPSSPYPASIPQEHARSDTAPDEPVNHLPSVINIVEQMRFS